MARRRFVGVSALSVVLMALGGCGADPSDLAADDGGGGSSDRVSNKITGSVSEWAVQVSAGKAEAGEVVFAIANFGSIDHEFLVVKTDYEAGKIPLGPDNRFAEDAQGVEVVDEIPEWAVNEANVLKVNLEAGKYQLLCNIAGHYKNGMFTAFEVLPGDGNGGGEGSDGGMSSDGDVVSNDITGSVKEWAVNVSAHESLTGEVNFTMANEGTIPHEFLVVKTDFEPGKIPLGKDNRFSEDGPGIEVVDEIPEWEAGTTGTLKVNLSPGSYQLLCNIAGHYKAGMWTALTVRDPGAEAVTMSNDVSGEVKDFKVNIDAGGATAGDVKFTITNNGTIAHEFLVVKTDLEAGKIPLTPEKKFSEENPDLAVIDEIPEWEPGETKTLTVKLDPGKYQIVCNIVDHYKAGMWTPFTVAA